jgi:hypothetical protein
MEDCHVQLDCFVNLEVGDGVEDLATETLVVVCVCEDIEFDEPTEVIRADVIA